MPGDNAELKAWCEQARKILGIVRGSPQVSAVSRKDLRNVRHGFEGTSALIIELDSTGVRQGEAQAFEKRYGELVDELQRSSGGEVTKAIGQRMAQLEKEVKATLVDAHKEAYAGVVEKHEELKSLLKDVQSRNEQLEAGLDLSKERENLDTALIQASDKQYEEADRTLELVRFECANSTKQMNVKETRKKFTDLPKGEQLGAGQWAVKALMDYKPPGALDIPGTSFADVCPGQEHVNKSIVEAKIEAGLPGKPVIPAAISPEGKICLLDKHHTFVACVALGRPVQLALTAMPTFGGKRDWSECTWEKFTPKAVAAVGFSLKKEESAKHEGERVKNPDWKTVVPWRKDGQELDSSERPATPEETSLALERSEVGAANLDSETSKDFRKLLSDALAVESIHEHFANLCGGDDFKIKFDPNVANAYYEGTTIVLPTKNGKDGSPRSAKDLVDALIFESCNIEMKDKFKEFDSNFEREGGSLDQYGKDKAGLEASLTVFRSSKMVYLIQQQGGEVAEQGLANIEAIKQLDPTFFDEVVGGKNEEGVDHSEREKALVEKLKKMVCDTKHQADLDPEKKPEDLKNPQWLKSGEMYHYEKVRDMGPMAMNTLILKQVTQVAPSNWANKAEFHNWLSENAGLYTDERSRRPLLFCKLLDAVKHVFPNVNFSGLQFNNDMLKVAVANGDGVAELPKPPAIVMTEVASESSYEERERVFHAKLKQLREGLRDYQPTEEKDKRKKIRLEEVARKSPLKLDDEGDVEAVIKDVQLALEELG